MCVYVNDASGYCDRSLNTYEHPRKSCHRCATSMVRESPIAQSPALPVTTMSALERR